MHCLHGLAAQDFIFELKGGALLSKGFGIIQCFSEDIDIIRNGGSIYVNSLACNVYCYHSVTKIFICSCFELRFSYACKQ